MIFSHAPLGFIITYSTSKIWKEKLTKRETFWIFFIGILFSIFPDVDLFYYYFISSGETHRALITHTPFLYILLSLVVFLIGFIFKRSFVKLVALVVLLTSFSHLLLDSLGSGIAWLYPYNDLLYGFLSFSFLSEGFYGQYLFAIVYSLELLFILTFLGLLFFIKFKKVKLMVVFLVCVIILALTIIPLLFYLNQHMFSNNADNYYDDLDRDGIMNMRDLDMDGDGVLNLDDEDANNNNKSNIEDIIKTANKAKGSYYDKTEGKLYGLLSRFGFLSNMDAVLKPYDYAGIFLGKEMEEDFRENRTGYSKLPSKDYLFQDKPENLYTYCKHNNLILESSEISMVGDIVFYENNGSINHTSLLVEEPDIVLDAGMELKVVEVDIDDVRDRFGSTIYYCRILR